MSTATPPPSSVAPFPIRCTIVGAATAVATPLFPVIGSYRLACYLVPNKGARLMIVGSAAGVFSFAIRDALPYLVDHAELIAPMALANGGVAAVSYGALEAINGGPAKLLDRASNMLPRFAPIWLKAAGPAAVVGAGIGLATALIAPYTYATLTEWHFGIEVPSTARLIDRLIPVTAPTGFVAGALLGPTLRPAITGSPWLAAPAVLFFAGGALYLYRDAAPVEAFAVGKGPGAYYVDEETRIAASSVPRVDAVTLQIESQRGAERVDDSGELASKGAALREALSNRSVRVYADPRHARLDVVHQQAEAGVEAALERLDADRLIFRAPAPRPRQAVALEPLESAVDLADVERRARSGATFELRPQLIAVARPLRQDRQQALPHRHSDLPERDMHTG